LTHFIEQLGESIGARLLQVGSSVGNRAVETVLTVGLSVGAALGEQVGRASERIPLHTAAEMSRLQREREALLLDLSRSCVQQGRSEEQQRELARLTEACSDLTDKINDLHTALSTALDENGLLHSRCRDLERTLLVMRSEKDEVEKDNMNLFAAQERASERGDALENLLLLARQELVEEKKRFVDEEISWTNEMNRVTKEQAATRKEIEAAFKRAIEQLESAEQAKDSIAAELEVAKEMDESNKAIAQTEYARLRESMAIQQEWHKQRLDDREGYINNLIQDFNRVQVEKGKIQKELDNTKMQNIDLNHERSQLSGDLVRLKQELSDCSIKLEGQISKNQSLSTEMEKSLTTANLTQ
jgi:chromosome segregation ATPase